MIKAILQRLTLKKPRSLPRLSSIRRELIHTLGSISLAWQILFFYLPLLFLFVTSFTATDSGGFTLSHFTPILNLAYAKVLLNSLLLSLSTAVLCLLIAFPLTYFIVFKTKKWKYILLFFLIIPFWTNFLLHIYAWFFILEKNGLLNQLLMCIGVINEPLHILHTPIASLLLMVYYYLPFIALPIFSTFERFDISYYEASLTLGAGRVQTFSRIVLPMMQKAIISGFFLVFIPAFGEFLIPEFMGGDKVFYAGNVISLYLLGGATAPVGIAFTTLAICFLMICSFFVFLTFKTLFRHLQGDVHDLS